MERVCFLRTDPSKSKQQSLLQTTFQTAYASSESVARTPSFSHDHCALCLDVPLPLTLNIFYISALTQFYSQTILVSPNHPLQVISPNNPRRPFSTQPWSAFQSWLLGSIKWVTLQKWFKEYRMFWCFSAAVQLVTIEIFCKYNESKLEVYRGYKDDRLLLKYHLKCVVMNLYYKRHSEMKPQPTENSDLWDLSSAFLCCLALIIRKFGALWQVSVNAQSTSLHANTPSGQRQSGQGEGTGEGVRRCLHHLKGLWRQINKTPQFSLWFSCWQDAREERVALFVTSARNNTLCFTLCAIRWLQGWSRHRVLCS